MTGSGTCISTLPDVPIEWCMRPHTVRRRDLNCAKALVLIWVEADCTNNIETCAFVTISFWCNPHKVFRLYASITSISESPRKAEIAVVKSVGWGAKACGIAPSCECVSIFACPVVVCVCASAFLYFCSCVHGPTSWEIYLPEPIASPIVLYRLHHLLPVICQGEDTHALHRKRETLPTVGQCRPPPELKKKILRFLFQKYHPAFQSKPNHTGNQRQHHLDLAEDGSSDWLPLPSLSPFSPSVPLLPSAPVPEPPFDPLESFLARFRRRLGARSNNSSPSPSTQHLTSSSLRQMKYPEPFLPFLPPRRPLFPEDSLPGPSPDAVSPSPSPNPVCWDPLPPPLVSTPPHLLRPLLLLPLPGLCEGHQ